MRLRLYLRKKNKKLKILFIQPNCRSYRIAFFNGMAKHYSRIDLLHFGEKKVFNTNSQVNELETPYLFSFWSMYYVSKLRKVTKGFDVVIVGFDPHWLNIFFLPLFLKGKVIYWGHGLGKNKYLGRLRKFMFRQSLGLILYHKRNTADLTKKGLDKRKLYSANNTLHVSNSINTSKNEDKYYFLYVGRLQRRKELDKVLHAILDLKIKGIEKRVVILGDGNQEKNRLMEIVNENNLNDLVSFISGTTDDDTLKTIFEKAIAYVSPGHVGLGVLHSFSYGVPVITFRDRSHAPEYQNIIHNYNGYLLTNENEFSNTLSKSIDTFRELGENAFTTYSEEAKMDIMVNDFVNAINSLTNDFN